MPDVARTGEGVRGFLVPRGTPGFAARDIRQKLSLRASVTSELLLTYEGTSEVHALVIGQALTELSAYR